MLPHATITERLVRVPVPTCGPAIWLNVVDEVARIWDEVSAQIAISLADGYDRSEFNRDCERLKKTFLDMTDQTADYRERAEARDAIWAEIYQRIRQYRLLVQGKFDSNSEIVESLPKLVKPYRRTRI